MQTTICTPIRMLEESGTAMNSVKGTTKLPAARRGFMAMFASPSVCGARDVKKYYSKFDVAVLLNLREMPLPEPGSAKRNGLDAPIGGLAGCATHLMLPMSEATARLKSP